jgi:hypothetical protein
LTGNETWPWTHLPKKNLLNLSIDPTGKWNTKYFWHL